MVDNYNLSEVCSLLNYNEDYLRPEFSENLIGKPLFYQFSCGSVGQGIPLRQFIEMAFFRYECMLIIEKLTLVFREVELQERYESSFSLCLYGDLSASSLFGLVETELKQQFAIEFYELQNFDLAYAMFEISRKHNLISKDDLNNASRIFVKR